MLQLNFSHCFCCGQQVEKGLWKHCLFSIYLGNKLVLIDTRRCDRHSALPILSCCLRRCLCHLPSVHNSFPSHLTSICLIGVKLEDPKDLQLNLGRGCMAAALQADRALPSSSSRQN